MIRSPAASLERRALLDPPLAPLSADASLPHERPPDRAGSFRIVGLLGRGGMADVYAAVREGGAFEQRVAVKVLRRGLDTEDVLARFLRERSILARLEHPAIARLIDGGALADGRPYLVMELVTGQPIDVFAEERALNVEARLRLLLVACDAVAHAHRNLVIHRDLKPSNVMVSANGEVKLLDFGIAKILTPESSSRQTTMATRALTPAYAAPEQLAGAPTTTATDVWGLGALALALLPQAPPRWPSRLRGDLGIVVGKALALEPDRRYSSVAAFADDLRRHLDGRPVLARPELAYRIWKFVRRHRLVVSAAAAGALSLAAGAAVALSQASRARQQRDAAERARRRSEELIDFMLGDLQKKLEPTNRLDVVADMARAVVDSLDTVAAAERTNVDIAQRARVLMQLAETLNLQGHPKRGEAELRLAIELLTELVFTDPAAPPEIATHLARARILLARLLLDQGDSRGAADAARAAVRDWRSLLAARPQDPEARLGLASALNEAGRVLLVSADGLEAQQSHLEAIALLDTLPPDVLSRRDAAMQLYYSHQYAGRGFEFAGEFEAALEQYRIGIEQTGAYSAANPGDIVARYEVSTVTMDLGRALRKVGRVAEATAAFERALVITEEVVERDPGNHYVRSDLAACHGFLGRAHEVEGNLNAALDEFRANVAISEHLVSIEPENGSWNGFYAEALTKEGRVLLGLGRLDEAQERHQRALALRQRALDVVDQDAMARADVAESLLELGRVEARKGGGEAAESAWRRSAELLEAALRTSDFVMHRLRFARALLELGDTERARPLVERLLRERCYEPELLALCERRGITA